jgi:hypothetical protein
LIVVVATWQALRAIVSCCVIGQLLNVTSSTPRVQLESTLRDRQQLKCVLLTHQPCTAHDCAAHHINQNPIRTCKPHQKTAALRATAAPVSPPAQCKGASTLTGCCVFA